jgi:hypothetical protein
MPKVDKKTKVEYTPAGIVVFALALTVFAVGTVCAVNFYGDEFRELKSNKYGAMLVFLPVLLASGIVYGSGYLILRSLGVPLTKKPPTDEPSALSNTSAQQTSVEAPLQMLKCPHCTTQVFARPHGVCPACRGVL